MENKYFRQDLQILDQIPILWVNFRSKKLFLINLYILQI